MHREGRQRWHILGTQFWSGNLSILLYVHLRRTTFSLSFYHCSHQGSTPSHQFCYPSVMYFDQLSGACSTWKLVETLFSAVFNLFWTLKPFSVISRLKSTKNVRKWTKKCFCLLLKAGWHAKAGGLLEGLPQNCLFRLIFSLKKVWNVQKRLKKAEKSVSTSFQVLQAPESWSKHTTPILSVSLLRTKAVMYRLC